MMNVQHIINRIMEGRGIMRSLKERRKEKKGFDNLQQYPKVPSGFQCFECGEQFYTNEDRMQHLEKGSHGGNYDTGSPQEREDTRRLQ